MSAISNRFLQVETLEEDQIETLLRNGYEQLVEIVDLEPEQLAHLLDIDESKAQTIIETTDAVIIRLQEDEKNEKEDLPEEL